MLANKKLILTILTIALFSFHVKTAKAEDAPAQDNRIRTFIYGENDIYTIFSTFGYQTILELDPTEKILTISMGNPNLFKIVPSGHRIYIKSVVSNQITNMFVITDKRQYQFDLSSNVDNPRDIMYIARFLYPENLGATPSAIAEANSSPMNLYSRINLPNSGKTNYQDLRLSVPSTNILGSVKNAVNNIEKPMSMQTNSSTEGLASRNNDPRNNFLVRQSPASR